MVNTFSLVSAQTHTQTAIAYTIGEWNKKKKKSLPHAQRTQTQAKRNANTCTRIPKMDWKWMEKKHLNRFGFGKWIDAATSAHDRCK